jgi:pyruvate formate lyase activating enzyme
MISGMIFDIKRYAIQDGPGIRTAVFLKGCPLDCWWCHNPEGQRAQPQLMFRSNRCKSSKACLLACPRDAITWKEGSVTNWDECDDCGKCAEVCYAGAREIIGREIDINQLMAEIERDIPFYDQSEGGVTFTGGEPMQQREFLEEALLACKERQIHTTVDTSGHTSWENFSSILPLVDLFLFDVKLMDTDKHIKYTAVSNRRILDNLRKLSSAKAHIIVRLPLIPGINDDEENIELCGSFLAAIPYLDGVELMPYHEIGIAKYEALGMKYRLENTKSPTEEQIGKVEELLSNYHLPVVKHQSGRAK